MSDFQAAVIKTVQGIGYLSTFILSLVITIPMSMNQDQFKGTLTVSWLCFMKRSFLKNTRIKKMFILISLFSNWLKLYIVKLLDIVTAQFNLTILSIVFQFFYI